VSRRDWPFLVPIAVAVVLAVPILYVGEVAAQDTSDRVRAATLQAESRAAESVGHTVVARYATIRFLLSSALSPTRGRDPMLVTALRDGPTELAQSELFALHRGLPPEVFSVLALDQTGVVRLGSRTGAGATGRGGGGLLGRSDLLPLGGGAQGRIGTSYLDPASFVAAFAGAATYVSAPYSLNNTDVVAIGLRILSDDGRSPIGAIVVEISLGSLVGDALSPVSATAREAIVIDRSGQVVRRLTRAFLPDPAVGQDLSANVVVRRILAGERIRGEIEDPLGAGTQLAASARTEVIGGAAGADLDLGCTETSRRVWRRFARSGSPLSACSCSRRSFWASC
jgi:hypothetical protein